MTKNVVSLIMLTIFMSASTTYAQTQPKKSGDRLFDPKPKPSILPLQEADRLADEAVKELLEARNKVESKERNATYPTAGPRPTGREVEQNIQRRTRMAANDIVFNFAGRIYQQRPSPKEVCAGTILLDAAVKRHLENKLGPNASPNRKSYEAGELLRLEPGVILLYETIGTCTALQPWIEKPASAAKKK